jgi:hypothetical protein
MAWNNSILEHQARTASTKQESYPWLYAVGQDYLLRYCGLTVLGSKPAALAVSDGLNLNMPSPLDDNSDNVPESYYYQTRWCYLTLSTTETA